MYLYTVSANISAKTCQCLYYVKKKSFVQQAYKINIYMLCFINHVNDMALLTNWSFLKLFQIFPSILELMLAMLTDRWSISAKLATDNMELQTEKNMMVNETVQKLK